MSSPPTGDGAAEHDDVLQLDLYVAGQSPKSLYAIANLHRLCAEHVAARYAINVVDLAEHPSLARRDDILAIPTLVRRLPLPPRKIIGDLSDSARVLSCLLLAPQAS